MILVVEQKDIYEGKISLTVSTNKQQFELRHRLAIQSVTEQPLEQRQLNWVGTGNRHIQLDNLSTTNY
jgi:hypothetical protein